MELEEARSHGVPHCSSELKIVLRKAVECVSDDDILYTNPWNYGSIVDISRCLARKQVRTKKELQVISLGILFYMYFNIAIRNQ